MTVSFHASIKWSSGCLFFQIDTAVVITIIIFVIYLFISIWLLDNILVSLREYIVSFWLITTLHWLLCMEFTNISTTSMTVTVTALQLMAIITYSFWGCAGGIVIIYYCVLLLWMAIIIIIMVGLTVRDCSI